VRWGHRWAGDPLQRRRGGADRRIYLVFGGGGAPEARPSASWTPWIWGLAQAPAQPASGGRCRSAVYVEAVDDGHELSIRNAGGGAVRGQSPRSKISMRRMRPRQRDRGLLTPQELLARRWCREPVAVAAAPEAARGPWRGWRRAGPGTGVGTAGKAPAPAGRTAGGKRSSARRPGRGRRRGRCSGRADGEAVPHGVQADRLRNPSASDRLVKGAVERAGGDRVEGRQAVGKQPHRRARHLPPVTQDGREMRREQRVAVLTAPGIAAPPRGRVAN
jgi:hypothetical protein